jgi:hypothetical protein
MHCHRRQAINQYSIKPVESKRIKEHVQIAKSIPRRSIGYSACSPITPIILLGRMVTTLPTPMTRTIVIIVEQKSNVKDCQSLACSMTMNSNMYRSD